MPEALPFWEGTRLTKAYGGVDFPLDSFGRLKREVLKVPD